MLGSFSTGSSARPKRDPFEREGVRARVGRRLVAGFRRFNEETLREWPCDRARVRRIGVPRQRGWGGDPSAVGFGRQRGRAPSTSGTSRRSAEDWSTAIVCDLVNAQSRILEQVLGAGHGHTLEHGYGRGTGAGGERPGEVAGRCLEMTREILHAEGLGHVLLRVTDDACRPRVVVRKGIGRCAKHYSVGSDQDGPARGVTADTGSAVRRV